MAGTAGALASDALVVAEEATILEASVAMARERKTAVLVTATGSTDDGLLLGIVTERDVVSRVIAKGLDPASTLVGQIMTRGPTVAEAATTASSALESMHRTFPALGL